MILSGYSNAKRSAGVAAVFTGAAVGAAVSGVLLLVLSFVLVKVGTIPDGAAQLITAAVGCIGSFCAGWFAVKLFGSRGLLLGAVAGLLLCVSLAIAGFLARTPPALTALFIKCAFFTFSGAIGGIVRVNRRVKVRRIK